MKLVYFTHSLVSDWNHGNAHFQRGLLREWQKRGHDALAMEPADSWSRKNLLKLDPLAAEKFTRLFPQHRVGLYQDEDDIDEALEGADVVIVHEWIAPTVAAFIGQRRREGGEFVLLFHDTHHRAVSDPQAMKNLDLQNYDGVLAFGDVLSEIYREQGWGKRVWTWHEGADVDLYRPLEHKPSRDIVWIGNWGDGERAAELEEFLFSPADAAQAELSLYGVRYPDEALKRIDEIGATYGGWLPIGCAPEVYARHRMTIHVPRRYYAKELPGIPTIRMFEALACGVPLISAPWSDCENLFRNGIDYISVNTSEEMATAMRLLKHDEDAAIELRRNGVQTIADRHTCAHRVEELVEIVASLRPSGLSEQARQAMATL